MTALLATEQAHSWSRSRHVASGAALVLFVAVIVLYWPTSKLLADEWLNNGSYNHGPLVLLLALYWGARSDWRAARWSAASGAFGLLGTAVLSAAWLAAFAATIAVVQAALLPAILWCSILAVLGYRVARGLWFPFLLLYSAIPVMDYLRPPLQLLAAKAVEPLAGLWGVPVLVEGNFVQVPAGTFEIAGGCSGLRFIIVAEVIALCFAKLNALSRRNVALLVVLAFALAVAMNIVRVTLVVLVGNASDMTHPWVHDHVHVGWVLFGIALIPFLFVAIKLRNSEPSAPEKSRPVAGHVQLAGPKAPVLLPLAAALFVMSIAPVSAYQRQQRATPVGVGQPDVLQLLPGIGEWSGPDVSFAGWAPVFLGASSEASGVYRRDSTEVVVYANRYLAQVQDAELTADGNSVLGDWHEVRRSTRATFVEVEATSLDLRPWLIRYWYVVGLRTTPSVTKMKVYLGLGAFSAQPPAGLVAIAAPCQADCATTSRDLDDFMAAFRGSLDGLYASP